MHMNINGVAVGLLAPAIKGSGKLFTGEDPLGTLEQNTQQQPLLLGEFNNLSRPGDPSLLDIDLKVSKNEGLIPMPCVVQPPGESLYAGK